MNMVFCPVKRKLCKEAKVLKWEGEVLTCGLTVEPIASLVTTSYCPKEEQKIDKKK